MKKSLLALTFTLPFSLSLATEKPVLDIYTYGSFISGGIAEAITPEFEKDCNCTLKFHEFDDAQSIITRLKIEGKQSTADMVIGLDQNLMAEGDKAELFQANNVDLAPLKLPIKWDSNVYMPFDYGYFAFVYDSDKLQTPPKSFSELADSKTSIIIQDPRTSSPGLGLLLWNQAIHGDKANATWKKLSDNIVTSTKGWSEAYGLFLKGEADMVLSYTTSPFYHELAEQKTNYKAASFEEGHYLQVEVAAITKNASETKLANQFMRFMLSDAFQKRIPESNWMYPVTAVSEIPETFKNTPKPKAVELLDKQSISDNLETWVNGWLEAL